MRGAIFCALLCGLVHSAISQESTPAATSSKGTSPESIPTATKSNGASTESIPTATKSNGASTESIPTATKSNGASTESIPTATKSNGASTESIPTATKSNGASPESTTTATSSNGTSPESIPTATSSNGTSPGGDTSSAVSAPTKPGGDTSSAVSDSTKPGGDTSSAVSDSTKPGGDTSTAVPATTKPADYCAHMACGTTAAECIPIQDGRICRCPYSYYYDGKEKLCAQGKQFFGSLDLNTAYSDNLQNVTSKEYKKLYTDVNAFFAKCFMNWTDYAETIIAKISKRASTRSRTSSAAPGTVIEAINIFTLNSNINQTVLKDTIEEALNNDMTFSNFTVSNPCNVGYCDEETTICEPVQNGTIPSCKCMHSFFQRPGETRACTACAPKCTFLESKECVHKERGESSIPVCQCIAGYKHNKEKDNCEACSIGYSGKDCEDDFLLILIIVGSIGGALVLALLGGVIGLSLKAKQNKKSPDRERLLQHEENPVFSGAASTNDAHFPRVQVKPTVNTNNAASNPYVADEAFQRTVPTRDYDDDNDSWYEMSQRQNKPGNNSKY